MGIHIQSLVQKIHGERLITKILCELGCRFDIAVFQGCIVFNMCKGFQGTDSVAGAFLAAIEFQEFNTSGASFTVGLNRFYE